ncbi:MAG: YihY/virulence factor BrkB family protein [Phycisphaerales bacterium]|nr:YihY/virulence factor BrkB family protein [Phycisphaerales bacterium]
MATAAEHGRLSLARWARGFARRWGAWLGHESIPQMAAALAYRTIFSLIPILLLSLLVLRLFQDERAVVEQMLRKALALAGLDRLALSDSAEVTVQGRLEELVNSFSGLSFTGIGLVAAGTLIYAAMSLIIEVENSFNRIYGVSRGRSLVRRVMQYWMLLTLGPLLVLASFYTAEKFAGFARAWADAGANVFGPWVVGLTGYAISVAISTVLLLVVYLGVPNARVQWRAALSGGLIAAVLLELGKYGFRLYLDHAGFKTIYGSMALIPIFLLWIYITWVIVLFGLRSAYLIQHGHRLALMTVLEQGPGALANRTGQVWLEPAMVHAIAQAIAQGFARGTPTSILDLARHTGLAEPCIRQVLDGLMQRGVIHHIESASGAGTPPTASDRYTLARPATDIDLADLLVVGHDLCGGDDAPACVRSLRAAEVTACRGHTLSELLDTPPTPATAGAKAAAPVLAG